MKKTLGMANNTTMQMDSTAAVVDIMNEENKLNLVEAENATAKATKAANAADRVCVYCSGHKFVVFVCW